MDMRVRLSVKPRSYWSKSSSSSSYTASKYVEGAHPVEVRVDRFMIDELEQVEFARSPMCDHLLEGGSGVRFEDVRTPKRRQMPSSVEKQHGPQGLLGDEHGQN